MALAETSRIREKKLGWLVLRDRGGFRDTHINHLLGADRWQHYCLHKHGEKAVSLHAIMVTYTSSPDVWATVQSRVTLSSAILHRFPSSFSFLCSGLLCYSFVVLSSMGVSPCTLYYLLRCSPAPNQAGVYTASSIQKQG